MPVLQPSAQPIDSLGLQTASMPHNQAEQREQDAAFEHEYSAAQAKSSESERTEPDAIQDNEPSNSQTSALPSSSASDNSQLPQESIDDPMDLLRAQKLFDTKRSLPAGAQITTTQRDDAQLAETQVVETQVADTPLESAQLKSAQLKSAQLKSAQLKSAQLESAQLESAELESAELEGTELENAELEGAELEGTELESAELEGAELEGTEVESAELEGAELESAELEGAELEGAKLEGAKVEGVEIEGVEIDNIQGSADQAHNKSLSSKTPVDELIGEMQAFMLNGTLDASTKLDQGSRPVEQNPQMLNQQTLRRANSEPGIISSTDEVDALSQLEPAAQAALQTTAAQQGRTLVHEPKQTVLDDTLAEPMVSATQSNNAQQVMSTQFASEQQKQSLSEQSLAQTDDIAQPSPDLTAELAQVEHLDRTPKSPSNKTQTITAPPVQLSLTTPIDEPAWADKLIEKVRWLVNAQHQKVEIRLDPPDLGPLKLDISLKQEQAQVTITTHSPQVREMLDQHLPRLREMLEAQGFSSVDAQTQNQQEQTRQPKTQFMSQESDLVESESEIVASETHQNMEKPGKGRVDCYI